MNPYEAPKAFIPIDPTRPVHPGELALLFLYFMLPFGSMIEQVLILRYFNHAWPFN